MTTDPMRSLDDVIADVRLTPATKHLGMWLLDWRDVQRKNGMFEREAERFVMLAVFPDGAKVQGDGAGSFTLTLANGRIVMNELDGRSPYDFGSISDAYGRWLVETGNDAKSPFYGHPDFKEDEA